MTGAIRPRPGIMEITPYVAGESRLVKVEKTYKLSSNENPHGPSPKAVEAFLASAQNLHRYPSTDHGPLRAAIAEIHDLDVGRVICGDGSDEVISWLCQGFAGEGDEVLYTEHGFSMYRISALAAGARPVMVPETERRVDVDALIAACTQKTRLVFIANPANPTGTMLDMTELARLAEGIPPWVLLVLDGAYAEFAAGYDGGKALVEARENVFMTRTFSKIYGLGGLRVGWGYGQSAVIDVLNRLRGPFNVTSPSLAAAEAAVRDRDYLVFCRSENDKGRAYLRHELEAIGIASDVSSANFILARFADESEAGAADAALRARGVIVRTVAGYRLPKCLRITVGGQEANERVVAVLGEFMEGRR